jgi:biotin-(acetyl-CoA carboxylase) ligase
MIDEATRRSAILGEWVRLRAGDSIFEGTAEALDADGQLLLRTADGILQTMTSGEVTSQMPSGVPHRD